MARYKSIKIAPDSLLNRTHQGNMLADQSERGERRQGRSVGINCSLYNGIRIDLFAAETI